MVEIHLGSAMPIAARPGKSSCGPESRYVTDFGLARRAGIVTGGAGGLGRAFAKGFLSAGAYVAIADIDEAGAQAAAKALGAGRKAMHRQGSRSPRQAAPWSTMPRPWRVGIDILS